MDLSPATSVVHLQVEVFLGRPMDNTCIFLVFWVLNEGSEVGSVEIPRYIFRPPPLPYTQVSLESSFSEVEIPRRDLQQWSYTHE